MINDIDYMSCHNHSEDSNFRLKDSVIRAEDIISNAIETGYSGVAITDHETLSSHIRILKRYKQLKKLKQKYENPSINNEEDKEIMNEIKLLEKMPTNFKMALGNEIYLVDSLEDVRDNYESGVTKFFHFLLLAKNKKGHKQLRKISSSAWDNYFRQGRAERVPTIKKEIEQIIGNEKGNLIASTACLGGEFATLVYEYALGNFNAKKKIHKFITWCINLFGKENFFIEVQPTLEKPDKENFLDSHPQIIVNVNAVKIAKAYGLKYIATTDSHYLKKEHRKKVHEAYLHADEDNSSNRELADFYATTYMMEKDELFELLHSHLECEDVLNAFKNTMAIHEMIEDYDLQHSVIVPRDKHVPKFEIMGLFKDWHDKCPYIKKFSESQDEQERYFLYKCEEGFIKKNQELNEENIRRINVEMEEIWEASERINMRIAPYYILVEVLVNKIMWNVSYVGIARGSVTGFYTAYLMGITQMNPIKYGLPHWRHLSKERPELPDIDLDSEASKRQLIFEEMKKYYGYDNVLNILTLKTEGSKSACLTACRGFNVDTDIAQAMADMIPFERGSNWSLGDCFYGNDKKGRGKIQEFISEVEKYEGLKEAMFLIEGLVCGRSIHASGVYVFENGYIEQNSKMRAPNGSFTTAWTMKDSDYCGGLKVDCLTIKALDKIHVTMDLLAEYGVIEPEESIKSTYEKYIHPDVLEYDDHKMWKMLGDNSLIDAFQFDTPVGLNAARQVKPKSLPELAIANSLMRLMSENQDEQPIDTFIKYKNNIELWYKELEDWNLTQDEIKVCEKYLLPVSGVADTQEVVMQLVMEEKISGFDIPSANKMRKAIAKKDPKVLEDIEEYFYQQAKKINPNSNLPKYIWEVQIKRQLGYSFSQNHTFPYSGICVQEMNLAHRYDVIFWNTSCLTVNAGADENNDNNKNTQYGKIAKAIGEIYSRGQKVALPDIDKARFGFSPDLETHEIIFGLKGICGIGDDTAQAIIDNRPYTSLTDFVNKMEKYKNKEKENKFGNSAIITLIKAGAFDKLENKPRKLIMEDFLRYVSEPINKLTATHIPQLAELGLLTKEQMEYEYRLYKYKNYVCSKKFFYKKEGKSDSTSFYIVEQEYALPYFYEHFETNMVESRDYTYTDTGELIVKKGSLEREYKKLTQQFYQDVLNNEDNLKVINNNKFKELWDKHATGTISKWEMDSLSFYYHDHELKHIDRQEYMISKFDELPEVPTYSETYVYRGQEKPRFDLCRIAGTVLDTDKHKHTVTLLTPDGVALVKYYKGQFGFYNKQISHHFEGDKSSTVLEKSWFKRGNKLLITGYRRGDRFYPKKYNDSAFRHTTQLITDIDKKGKIQIQSERVNVDEL